MCMHIHMHENTEGGSHMHMHLYTSLCWWHISLPVCVRRLILPSFCVSLRLLAPSLSSPLTWTLHEKNSMSFYIVLLCSFSLLAAFCRNIVLLFSRLVHMYSNAQVYVIHVTPHCPFCPPTPSHHHTPVIHGSGAANLIRLSHTPCSLHYTDKNRYSCDLHLTFVCLGCTGCMCSTSWLRPVHVQYVVHAGSLSAVELLHELSAMTTVFTQIQVAYVLNYIPGICRMKLCLPVL